MTTRIFLSLFLLTFCFSQTIFSKKNFLVGEWDTGGGCGKRRVVFTSKGRSYVFKKFKGKFIKDKKFTRGKYSFKNRRVIFDFYYQGNSIRTENRLVKIDVNTYRVINLKNEYKGKPRTRLKEGRFKRCNRISSSRPRKGRANRKSSSRPRRGRAKKYRGSKMYRDTKTYIYYMGVFANKIQSSIKTNNCRSAARALKKFNSQAKYMRKYKLRGQQLSKKEQALIYSMLEKVTLKMNTTMINVVLLCAKDKSFNRQLK